VNTDQLLMAAIIVAVLIYTWLTDKECREAKQLSDFYLNVLTDVANKEVEIRVYNQGEIEIRNIKGE